MTARATQIMPALVPARQGGHLIDAVDHIVRRHAEGAGDNHDGGQARLAPAALERADLGAVEPGPLCDLALRQARFGAPLAEEEGA